MFEMIRPFLVIGVASSIGFQAFSGDTPRPTLEGQGKVIDPDGACATRA